MGDTSPLLLVISNHIDSWSLEMYHQPAILMLLILAVDCIRFSPHVYFYAYSGICTNLLLGIQDPICTSHEGIVTLGRFLCGS